MVNDFWLKNKHTISIFPAQVRDLAKHIEAQPKKHNAYKKKRVGYSSVNTARSVFSTIIKTENEIPFGELPLVCRFLKGVLNLRTAHPRCSTKRDVSVVLKYIKSLQALKQCDLKNLSYCLAILLFIANGQRDQILFYMNTDRLYDVRGRQGKNFCSKIIETITSRTSSGTNGVFKIPRSTNLCCKSF